METPSNGLSASQRRRPVACIECRQNKIIPSRVLAVGERIVNAKSRETTAGKAELVREIQRIRGAVENPEALPPQQTPTVEPPFINVLDGVPQPADNVTAATLAGVHRSPVSVAASCYSPNLSHDVISTLQGQKRSIDGAEIAPTKINDCFSLFFAHYSPQVPVVDRPAAPEAIFEKSPLLFWTIVTIGSRKYSQDPTVCSQLCHRIVDLAFHSLKSRQAPIQIVQALVLLCAWPLPVEHLYQDKVHVLAGPCMQLALQIGLHVAGVGQDFARERVQAHATEKAFRALLWRYCVIVCQSASIVDGLPPTMLLDAFQPDWADHDGTIVGPSQLALRTKLHHIQTSATCKIVSHFMATPDDGVLQALIEMFDSQARMLQLQLHDEIDTLTLYCTRLHICVSRFMLKQRDVSPGGFIDLYGISISLVEKFAELDTTTDFAFYSTLYLSRTLGLAAFVILKLYHSSMGLAIDRARGESCYFAAIRLYKKRSLLNSFNADLESKLAVILTELWSSSMIFRTSEGNIDSVSVRVRSRLTMNVFFDCLWWWRQEFRGQPDPFGSSSQVAAGTLPVVDPFAVFPDIFTYDENYFGMYEDTFPVRDFGVTA